MKCWITFLITTIFLIGCHHQKQIDRIERAIVFSDSTAYTWKLPIAPAKLFPFVSIAAVGDIMLGNHTTYYIEKYGVNYPFDSTKTILSQPHLTFGNLESPFTTTGPKFEKRFNFKVPPEYAVALINAGFDVVTLANNHILDYGIEGLKNTLTVLDSLGLAYCGAGLTLKQAQKPAIIETNGFKVAFLGYSMTFPEEFWASRSRGGTNYPYNITSNIQQADSLSDFIVVTFHWGTESKNYPKDYQKYYAHLAIDHGADLVLGHHPHVLQGLEIYKNRLIAYSLGNFSFSSYSGKATESIILKVYLVEDGLFYAKVIPVTVDNSKIAFQPRILRGADADSVLAHLRKYSEELNSSSIIDETGYIWGKRNYFYSSGN